MPSNLNSNFQKMIDKSTFKIVGKINKNIIDLLRTYKLALADMNNRLLSLTAQYDQGSIPIQQQQELIQNVNKIIETLTKNGIRGTYNSNEKTYPFNKIIAIELLTLLD